MVEIKKITYTDNLRQGTDKINSNFDTVVDEIKAVDDRVDTIIVGGGPDKDPELVDIRNLDPSYTPQREINVAGDVTRDMQAQLIDLKNDVELEISIINDSINKRVPVKQLYKKSVFKKLPLRFPDYDTIIDMEGPDYIYPQSFTIDWDEEEIFVLYSPSDVSTKQWVVVYDLETTNYKGCFSAGNAGAEGIVVKREGASRYLYVKDTGRSLGKYDITTLPGNLSSVSPIATYDVGLHFNFSYRNGVWLIEQAGAPLGRTVQRSTFAFFDDDFNRIGAITISPSIGGYHEGAYVDKIPKRQGIAIADGYLVQVSGGVYNKGDNSKPVNYQGILTINYNGKLQTEGIIEPAGMIETLEAAGYVCGRAEYEGVHVSPPGDIYTLFVHQHRYMPESTSEGIIIFKEMDEGQNYIDFSPCSKSFPRISEDVINDGLFPRSGDGKMYDPYGGEELDTLDKIIDFMINADIRQFAFYTSSTPVSDINNNPIPTGTLVIIYNPSNQNVFAEYFNLNVCRKFFIYGPSGSRIQAETFPAVPS